MDCVKFVCITKKYKKCPNCGSSWKDTKLQVELEDEKVHIYCECGFSKYVDENNKEISN